MLPFSKFPRLFLLCSRCVQWAVLFSNRSLFSQGMSHHEALNLFSLLRCWPICLPGKGNVSSHLPLHSCYTSTEKQSGLLSLFFMYIFLLRMWMNNLKLCAGVNNCVQFGLSDTFGAQIIACLLSCVQHRTIVSSDLFSLSRHFTIMVLTCRDDVFMALPGIREGRSCIEELEFYKVDKRD
jgi:hypothetical protein